MPKLHIDGKPVEVEARSTLLNAARRLGVEIPTLCHHPGLEAQGGCRLCLVEITRASWKGWSKLVVSCIHPAEDGLEVSTESPRVRDARGVVFELLLARCPDVPAIGELARRWGVESTSFPTVHRSECVLCGLCTRACQQIGANAISSVGRGGGREIAPPFRAAPSSCVGCLSCARVCPTGCIRYQAAGDRVSVWGREFQLLRCPGCGVPTVTAEMAALIGRRQPALEGGVAMCPECRRRKLAGTVVQLGS